MEPPSKPSAVSRKKKIPVFQILLVIAVIIGTGYYLYTLLAPSAAMYGTITAGTLGARYSGTALIVRDEIPYDSESVSSIEYVCDEGTMVSRNSTICYVYSSGYSTKESNALQNYREQIKEYETTIINAETTYDARMVRLSSDVLDLGKEIRAMIAGQRGNLLNQEKFLNTAIALRQQYIKSKYSTDQRLSRLLDEETNQQQRINSWTKTYVATSDVIVSFYSDEYEYGLTPSNYQDLTSAQVRSMISGNKPELSTLQKGKTTIYRTVQDGLWYILLLVNDPDWTPIEGQSYELKLERYDTTLNGRVRSFTRQGGDLLVRLEVRASVLPVLYIRSCRCEVGDYVQSLCVPSRAIYVQDNMTGVVIADGSNHLFIPVNVLLEDGQSTYVESIQQGLLREGMTVLLF